jgi:hypothetical protein
VPGLTGAAIEGVPDLRLWLGLAPLEFATQAHRPPPLRGSPRKSQLPLDSGVDVWTDNGFFRIRYIDETEFFIDEAVTQVWATWPAGLTLEDTATYLLGPIMSLVIRLRGGVTLHASAMRIDDVAVAIVGPQGAGKSTTAASFAIAGYPVLTDDVASVRDADGVFEILPAYPRIRLWPSSVRMLFPSRVDLPLLTPNWDKRYLELGRGSYRFEPEAVPIGAIYFLHPRSDDASAPKIVEEQLRAGMVQLIGNLTGDYLLDQILPVSSFHFLRRLAQNVPLRRIIPHANASCLPQLRELIVADVRSLQTAGVQEDTNSPDV